MSGDPDRFTVTEELPSEEEVRNWLAACLAALSVEDAGVIKQPSVEFSESLRIAHAAWLDSVKSRDKTPERP